MQLLTARDVAVILKLQLPRVYELTRGGVLPVVRLGCRQLRYDAETLRDWIDKGGVNGNQEDTKNIQDREG